MTSSPKPISQAASTPVYTLNIVTDTWLKLSTVQGSVLPDDQRQFVSSGTLLPIASYARVDNDHIKVTFGLDSQGKQVFFKGRNTWYVYRPVVQILKNGQAIDPSALSNSAPINPTPANLARRGKISAKGLRLLKSFEGLELEAYIDAVGVWTIGYGTTTGVTPGMRITEAQAEEFLKRDLMKFENAVSKLVKVSLNDDQFSALVTFVYNVGDGAFADSTLLRLLNRRDYQGAADQLLRWNKGNGGVELAGLTRRRKAERALFLSQDFTLFL
ncbi:MAG: lysozyme [Cyanobacteria bacterium CRU_2_1]|nr:lysozyme [Cyanobacteria bacterium RU_5_0]NJR57586.1 lysozyme [Cyanobacteria bacterium CRU_2_1]